MLLWCYIVACNSIGVRYRFEALSRSCQSPRVNLVPSAQLSQQARVRQIGACALHAQVNKRFKVRSWSALIRKIALQSSFSKLKYAEARILNAEGYFQPNKVEGPSEAEMVLSDVPETVQRRSEPREREREH